MRLYPYPDPVPVVDAPEGHFKPEDDGGFDFPDTLFTRLHSTHHNKEKRWETAVERQRRTHGEEHDRRRDPETLYNAVAEIARATKNLTGGQAPALPADVLAEFAAMRAQVAELQAQLTELQQPVAAPVPFDDHSDNGEDDAQGAESKPASRRKSPAKAGNPE